VNTTFQKLLGLLKESPCHDYHPGGTIPVFIVLTREQLHHQLCNPSASGWSAHHLPAIHKAAHSVSKVTEEIVSEIAHLHITDY
jgi:hypothetical protein